MCYEHEVLDSKLQVDSSSRQKSLQLIWFFTEIEVRGMLQRTAFSTVDTFFFSFLTSFIDRVAENIPNAGLNRVYTTYSITVIHLLYRSIGFGDLCASGFSLVHKL